MRIDINGTPEEVIRKIGNEMNISYNVLAQIMFEVWLENITHQDTKKIIKLKLSQIIISRQKISEN